MFLWTKWRNPIALFVVTAMLGLAAYGSLAASGDINDAADGQAQISALAKAAEDLELAWFQMMGADALAATGQAPDESQGFYDGGLALYNQSKAVLAAAGREQIDLALAGSDQGLAAMNVAFEGTLALAATGDIAAATDNHMNNTVAVYNNVEPAVLGLAQVGEAGSARLTTRLDGGASDLRLLGWLSVAVALAALAFGVWTAWNIWRKEQEEAENATEEQTPSIGQAA